PSISRSWECLRKTAAWCHRARLWQRLPKLPVPIAAFSPMTAMPASCCAMSACSWAGMPMNACGRRSSAGSRIFPGAVRAAQNRIPHARSRIAGAPLPALLPSDHHPGPDIAAEVFVSLLDPGRHEQRVARFEGDALGTAAEPAPALGHDIDFVLIVRR